MSLLTTVTTIALFVIAISIVILLYRAVKGPTNADRAVALDTIGINMIAMTGLLAILLTTTKFNDVILLLGILGFIGTIAIAKFIERGVIIDGNRD